MVEYFHPLHRPPPLGDGNGSRSLHKIRVPGEGRGKGGGGRGGGRREGRRGEGRRGGTLIRLYLYDSYTTMAADYINWFGTFK